MAEHYAQIGRLLTAARKDMRLSVDQAAQMLHIRVRYLAALEEGDLDALPGLPYAKGYLQTYAAFLHLDKVEILRRFEQVEERIAKRGFYLPNIWNREKAPTLWAVWGGLGVAILVYAVWSGMQQSQAPSLVSLGLWPDVPVAEEPDVVACLKPQTGYYPPCYRADEVRFSLLPLRSQNVSVTDLAN